MKRTKRQRQRMARRNAAHKAANRRLFSAHEGVRRRFPRVAVVVPEHKSRVYRVKPVGNRVHLETRLSTGFTPARRQSRARVPLSAYLISTVKGDRNVTSKTTRPVRPKFSTVMQRGPYNPRICSKRITRREVLFAKGRLNGSAKKHYTVSSTVYCRRS